MIPTLPIQSLYACILFSTIICSICPIEALSLHKNTFSPEGNHSSRRAFVSISVTTASAILLPQESQALQKKNEALCGTGFFEHIYEYKCTTIGDISDEAKSKSMDESMEIQTDLLMERLNSFEKKDTQKRDTIEFAQEKTTDSTDEK